MYGCMLSMLSSAAGPSDNCLGARMQLPGHGPCLPQTVIAVSAT